ncbi:matrixin family metalloprotease [Poriferisphaera sp. WC338]|uniref:matrixin family metalloprotease n=1 Tax=Poriferisphaera sp. WC338 TaxID=3425129 RepID=UPI003D8170A0
MRSTLAMAAVAAISVMATNSIFALDSAFNGLSRWSITATDGFIGSSSTHGIPVTLTWSIVPDLTATDSSSSSGAHPSPHHSTLISVLDAQFDPTSTGGADLTQRNWFGLFDNAYKRWGEVSGLTFVYEPNDDGVKHGAGGSLGAIGTRGDIRVAGASIDGHSGSNTLAYNYFPINGDMLLDIDNASGWELFDINSPINSSTNNPRLINILEHEIGHGIGIPHVISNNSRQLMEPFINTSFYGPQMDDILMVQRLYGDAYEAAGGNDSTANAQDLGTLTDGTSWSIGNDADRTASQLVTAQQSDFVSIDDNSDIDVYKFQVATDSEVDILLDPLGITYNQGPQGGSETSLNMRTLSNLNFELLNALGSVIETVSANGAGIAESLINYNLSAGDYFLRVTGTADDTQFYGLSIDVTAIPEPTALALLSLSSLILLHQRRIA